MTEFKNNPIDIDLLPDYSALKYHKLDIRYRNINMVSTSILFFIILMALVIIFIIVEAQVHHIIFIIVLTVFLAFYALAMGIAYKGYHNMGYAVREKDILFKSGVIFKNTIVIPFNRVQHSEITQGPIDRWYGLYELNIYTAGGSGSDLNIPGLRQDNALKIKDFVTQNVRTFDEEE